ncbi:MAG: DMT family transporter [Acidimicrobiia bacterium]
MLIRIFGLVGAAGISFSAIFFRLADVTPATAAFFRAAYAIPLLGLATGMRRERASTAVRLGGLGAGLFLAVDINLWHHAIESIGAGLATTVVNIQVVFVGAAAWALHREKPTLVAFATVPVVFIGVGLVSGLGREDAFGANPALGASLAVGAAVGYSAFLLAFRAVARKAPQRVVGGLFDATVGVALGAFIAGLFDPGFSLSVTWPEHGWLILLALVAQAAGWLAIAYALPRMPALETSVLLLLQPALTILWAGIIFTEELSEVQWIGVVLILGGVALLSGRSAHRQPSATTGTSLTPVSEAGLEAV